MAQTILGFILGVIFQVAYGLLVNWRQGMPLNDVLKSPDYYFLAILLAIGFAVFVYVYVQEQDKKQQEIKDAQELKTGIKEIQKGQKSISKRVKKIEINLRTKDVNDHQAK